MSMNEQQADNNEHRQDDEGERPDKDENDRISNDDGTVRPAFDEITTYHPVFCLTTVPDEYINALVAYTHDLEAARCLEITSSSASNTLEEIKANLAHKGLRRLMPFRGWTIDQVYAFYKAHLCPDENIVGPGIHFTSFTFLAVDDACLQGREECWEAILCSDAPDFGEPVEEVVLKSLRLPLKTVVDQLDAQEMLLSTMSTIDHPSGLSLNFQPSPWLVQVPGENGLFNVAPAVRARENKRRAIESYKSADEALGSAVEI